ncbi:MAG: hypothetical protein QNJ98_01405 [Planctomycetota bacterium]|nr:hypothetical protein [Planctomycetota bacterium]
MARSRPLSARVVPVLFGLLLGVFALSGLVAQAEEAPLRDVPAYEGTVDYKTHIEPLMKAYCFDCHGPGDASGGLNLTSHAMAGHGGDSGGRILGGPLATNTLWERIATADADYRMPKGGELTDKELSLFRAWIEQGSKWTTVAETKAAPTSSWPSPVDAVQLTVKKHPAILIALLAVLLIAVRLSSMAKSGSPFATGKGKPLVAVFRHVRVEHVLLVFLGLVAFDLMAVTRNQIGRAEALTDHVSRERDNNPVYTYFFGDPPKPHRHPVPKTIDATYWRGNCERGDHLYNFGRYRTCTMHLSLCDKDRNKLDIGDAVPADGLYLRFDIKRSPNTADTMYARAQMSRVFADPTWYTGRIRELEREPVLLETIKEDWEWSAYIPLGTPGDGSHEELWYVYQNLRTDGVPFKPKVHLGITYALEIADGRIAKGSDLWLGNLFWNPTMEPPKREFKLPLAEWLHHEPIPEIPPGHKYHEGRAHK